MRKPSPDEVAIFAYVREYLRWERPALEADLSETDNLFESGDDSIRFGSGKGENLWDFYALGYFLAARALLEEPLDKILPNLCDLPRLVSVSAFH